MSSKINEKKNSHNLHQHEIWEHQKGKLTFLGKTILKGILEDGIQNSKEKCLTEAEEKLYSI